MKDIKKYILLILTLFCFVGAFAQQKVIVQGRVLDKSDNSPLAGANIIEVGKDNRTINGTVTDIDGNFRLELKDSRNTVKASMMGYDITTLEGDLSKPQTVYLGNSNQVITDVVVTATSKSGGMRNVDERDNASARVKVDMMDIKDAGALSASDALQGKVSGLDIMAASGDPGSGANIVIRGLSTMGNAKPLIVIDGISQFSVPSDFNLSSAGMEDISTLINIPVKDIKTIEVLKDGASTAEYGSKGAAGVLLIETRRGQQGKVQFDYTYKHSWNIQPKHIPMLNGDEYIMLQLEELHNSKGVFTIPSEIAYDKDYAGFYNYSANTDWIGALTQNAITKDHYFSVSGGGEKTRFFSSLSYIDEGGTTIRTGNKLFSTRMNLDYFMSKKLVFSVQFNYTRSSTDKSYDFEAQEWDDLKNIRNMAYRKAPNMSIWEYDAYGNLTGNYFSPINNYQGNGSTYYNPVAVAELGKNNTLKNSLKNSFVLKSYLTKWLTWRETLSFQYDGSKTSKFLPYSAIGTDWLNSSVNQAIETNSMGYDINVESQLSFDVPFTNKDHVLTGAFTNVVEQNESAYMYEKGNHSPSTSITEVAGAASSDWLDNGSTKKRDIGFAGNLNYKYKDRYIAQAIARLDGSSAFGSNSRWGLFNGLSLAWRFSKEEWLKDFSFLGDSKFRISYGTAGRQPDKPYARFAIYESSGRYLTYPATVLSQAQLNNMRWENTSTFDVGLELNLFQDRLYINADYYNKVTTDILFKDYKVPLSAGLKDNKFLFYNGGKMQNKGWELMMDYKLLKTKDITWSVNFNISHNENAFLELPAGYDPERSTDITNGNYPKRIELGQAMGSFFGFKYLGVYATDADAVAKDAQGNTILDAEGNAIPMTYKGTYTFKGGDAKYEDVNHDGKIDLNDVQYIGNSNPKYTGGFGTTFKYKGLDISCSFHYRFGFDIINGVAIGTQGMNGVENQSKAVLNRWRVQGQNFSGMLPRAYYGNPANNLGSDRYVEDGSYLRLLNLTVSYRFSKEICDKLKVRSLNLAASVRKFITFTRYTGQDPEISQDASDPFWVGVDNAKTPPAKIITINLAIGF